jgi:hypothetical protein
LKRWFIGRLFFSWVNPIMRYSKTEQIYLEQYGKLSEKDSLKSSFSKLSDAWHGKHTQRTGDNELMLALLTAYKWEYMLVVFLACLNYVARFIAPLIVNVLMEYLTGDREDVENMYFFFALLIVNQAFVSVF